MKSDRQDSGASVIEIFALLALVGVLIFLALPTIRGSLGGRGQMVSTVSNMRQLHLATEAMAQDRIKLSDTNIGWPGDIGGTFSNWTTALLSDYLTTNVLCHLLSTHSVRVAQDTLPQRSDSALLLYAVSAKSVPSTIFLTTANFTNTPTGGNKLEPSAKPFGDKGFVIFRKDGAGAVLKPQVVGMTNAMGAYAPLCP